MELSVVGIDADIQTEHGIPHESGHGLAVGGVDGDTCSHLIQVKPIQEPTDGIALLRLVTADQAASNAHIGSENVEEVAVVDLFQVGQYDIVIGLMENSIAVRIAERKYERKLACNLLGTRRLGLGVVVGAAEVVGLLTVVRHNVCPP